MKTTISRNPKRRNKSTPVPVGKGVKVMATKRRRNRTAANPRRRHHHRAARRNPTVHYRRRRNPGETSDILTTAVWAVGGTILANLLAPMIPIGQSTIEKGIVKVGLGMALLYAFKSKGQMGKGLALGAAISGINDVVAPYIPSSLTAPQGGTTAVTPINVAALPPAAQTAVNQQLAKSRRMGQVVYLPSAGIVGQNPGGLGRFGGIRRVG